MLKEVFDRTHLPPFSEIPDDKATEAGAAAAAAAEQAEAERKKPK